MAMYQEALKYNTMAISEQNEPIGDDILAVLGPLRCKTIFCVVYSRRTQTICQLQTIRTAF
jgi:hypothetical protein